MSTAPSGPMTAISAVGQAKLASVRMCLLAMTQYAPPYALRVMTVIFGTVASAKAKSSFAPCLMMPPNSCWVPGRKPGTSSNVISGILKASRSEEHTSELQSPDHLVCRLLLEKKNNNVHKQQLYGYGEPLR